MRNLQILRHFSPILHNLHIIPPKWLAGSSRVATEVSFYGGGREGAQR